MPVEPQVGNVGKAFLRPGAGVSELHHCAWIRSVRKGAEMIAKENITFAENFSKIGVLDLKLARRYVRI